MKKYLTLTTFLLSSVLCFAQTRNVVVNTNGVVVSPTNFWSTDAASARSGLGLGSAATNPSSAFQPASSSLTNLANNNGASLTNIPVASVVGAITTNASISGTASNVTGVIAITNGGSGATTAGGARTNFGLIWDGLTNSNATTFQTALFGVGTNPILVNSTGSIISPTNFWQEAPINTILQKSEPVVNATNNAQNVRNLFLYSLTPTIFNVTNTIQLSTNGSTYEGDVATIIHEGPTSSVTAIRIIGASTNLITLNQFQEAVKFIYKDGSWRFADNVSYVEPINFSGTNSTVHAAESRTNLGLGANWLTNTNATNFRTDIGLGTTNNVAFSNIVASGTLTSTGVVTAFTNLNVGGTIAVTNTAETRTNLGLGLLILTSTNNASFQAGLFQTNSIPTNTANVNSVGFNTVIHWMEVNVVTNGVTNSFRIPLFQ